MTSEQHYDDDVRHCAQLRLGEAHPPHDYTYLLLDEGGAPVAYELRGVVYCIGLPAPADPYPKRPKP